MECACSMHLILPNGQPPIDAEQCPTVAQPITGKTRGKRGPALLRYKVERQGLEQAAIRIGGNVAMRIYA
jgi:hypothetical protein